MTTISDQDLEDLQQEMEGTCMSLARVIENNNLDVDEDSLRDRLLDGPSAIEACIACAWWFRTSELEFDERRGGGVCASCDPDLHDT